MNRGKSRILTKLHIQKIKRDKNLRGLGVFYYNGLVYLYLQSSTNTPETFHIATSSDGYSFQIDKRLLSITIGQTMRQDIRQISHLSISKNGDYFIMLYTIEENGGKILQKAWSKDLYIWSLEGPMISVTEEGIIIPNYLYKRQSVLFAGNGSLFLYFSKDLISWNKTTKPLISPRAFSFDSGPLTIAGAFPTEKGILLLYLAKQHIGYAVGVALIDASNPETILWQTTEPIWISSAEWDTKDAYPIGTVLIDGTIISYWHVPGKGIFEVAYAVYKIADGISAKDISLNLNRSQANPLISPNQKNAWEAFNTFNPAAIYDQGKVHILYRAQGPDWVSVVGYASSSDGITIDERLNEPIYIPTQPFESTIKKHNKPRYDSYSSGGGYAGCEDPRITKINERYYMTYVAYDGVHEPRIALTSISVDNFLSKRWLWERPVLISKPGVIDKSAMIFPEKVHGKYVIIHRVYPDILIDFVDSLEFDGINFLKGEYRISVRPDMWDSRKIGAGAPPIKTKDGWLLIYYATCDQEGASRYLMGAMLLDLEDPTKVLYRSKSPILEPHTNYEWEGFKGGIVYPCGAVVIGETLYVYYGSADSYVCVATAKLETFLQELKYSDIAKLTTPVVESLFDIRKTARNNTNPILSPIAQHAWEAGAVLNGCMLSDTDIFRFVYRADSIDQDYQGKHMRLSTIGYAESNDGIHLFERKQLITPTETWDKFGCEDPRITKIDREYFIFYTALSDYPFDANSIRVGLAVYSDFTKLPEKHLITPFNAKAMTLFPKKINGKYAALLTVNTDKPELPDQIALAIFDNKEDMWSPEYWHTWYQELDKHILPLRRMTSDQIEVGAPPIKTSQGWLLIYSHIQHYDKPNNRILGIEAVMLDINNPQKIIAWTDKPLLTPKEAYEIQGADPRVVFPSGAYIQDNTLHVYYGAANTYCCLATFPLEDVYSEMRTNALLAIKAEKSDKNPLMQAIPQHFWEAKAVFNPAVFYEQGFKLVYRAMSPDNTSVLGYADTIDGTTISNRSEIPIYAPRAAFENKKRSGNSGCEDPRITQIGKTFYMCYTAYDGVNPPRIALTSIAVHDFLTDNFNWKDPVLISPPGIDDKDGAIFPEKINGKYVVIHRVQNSIVLDYIDSLEDFDGNHWVHNDVYIPPRAGNVWDSEKIGVCAPPIKTPQGWLLLYHGVSKLSHEYRIGAMLLDLNNPANVLSRTAWPILEPEMPYEKEGIVKNVVFSCGAIAKGNTLFIYYGGADTYICLATVSMSSLIVHLQEIMNKRYLIK